MWELQSTTRLLKAMSETTEPAALVRLFFDHIRQSVNVQRALVLSSAGLLAPQYRVFHNIYGIDAKASVIRMNDLRQGGILAKLLYLGEFQNIPNFSPDAGDPGFDLLEGSRSLMAFPLFEKGSLVGMVIMLGSSSQPHNPADLCVLATITSMLGRAIETQKLANQLEVARRALDAELKAAADVQRWMLPPLPTIDEISIAASYRTARYSSGDYYDVGRLADGRVGVFIADVSGKGAPAAVLMAVLRSIIHDEVDRTGSTGPGALLDYADARLQPLRLSERGVFITAFCAVINPATGHFVYSSAGHNPPRLLRARDRTVVPLDRARSIPLGIVDEMQAHTEESAVLTPGDTVLFYTDGITEARSPNGEFFGVERVDGILRTLPLQVTPDVAVDRIARSVANFEGSSMPADDQTLLALSQNETNFPDRFLPVAGRIWDARFRRCLPSTPES